VKENKIPIVILSILFAALVWSSVNLGNTFQTTIDIPIQTNNLKPTLGIATPIPETMRLIIQGSGWQLLNTILSPNLRYNLDFSEISRNDTIFTSHNLEQRVNIPHDLKVLHTSPETMIVKLDVKATKKIAVALQYDIQYREGFGIVGSFKTVPESISVTGALALLKKIDSWPSEQIVLTDVNAPMKITIPIRDTLSNEIERHNSTVSVSFDVQPIAEKTISNIPIEVNQVPEHRNVILIPPTVTVIIRSGVNTIAPITEKDFYAYIDYKSILLDTSGLIQPIILGPDLVRIVQQDPEKIQYVVRK
jgi:YbbR domain-containing protein